MARVWNPQSFSIWETRGQLFALWMAYGRIGDRAIMCRWDGKSWHFVDAFKTGDIYPARGLYADGSFWIATSGKGKRLRRYSSEGTILEEVLGWPVEYPFYDDPPVPIAMNDELWVFHDWILYKDPVTGFEQGIAVFPVLDSCASELPLPDDLLVRGATLSSDKTLWLRGQIKKPGAELREWSHFAFNVAESRRILLEGINIYSPMRTLFYVSASGVAHTHGAPPGEWLTIEADELSREATTPVPLFERLKAKANEPDWKREEDGLSVPGEFWELPDGSVVAQTTGWIAQLRGTEILQLRRPSKTGGRADNRVPGTSAVLNGRFYMGEYRIRSLPIDQLDDIAVPQEVLPIIPAEFERMRAQKAPKAIQRTITFQVLPRPVS